MRTIAERHTIQHFKLKLEVKEINEMSSLIAAAEKQIQNAENQVHKLFLRYVETVAVAERNDHFASWNRDAWVIGFGEWLAEQQREYIKKFGCSND